MRVNIPRGLMYPSNILNIINACNTIQQESSTQLNTNHHSQKAIWGFVLNYVDDSCYIVLHAFRFRMLLGYISPQGIFTRIYVSWLLCFLYSLMKVTVWSLKRLVLSSWSASVSRTIKYIYMMSPPSHTGLFAYLNMLYSAYTYVIYNAVHKRTGWQLENYGLCTD